MRAHRLLAFLLAVLVPLALLPLLAGPAHADHSSESHSDAQFLDANLLGVDLSTVVGIEGADADYFDGHTAGTEDYESENLDVTALSTINLELDNELTVGDLLQLGVVTQEAWAGPEGDSWATTGTVDASLNLMLLLDPALVDGVLSTATLDLGAISTYAEIDGETGQLVRTTEIAEVTLNLDSPLVEDTTAQINALTDTLVTEIDGLEQVITDAVNGSIGEVLALLGVTGDVETTTTVDVDTTRLDTALANLFSEPLCTDLVCIDPTTGTITADLAGGIDLNNLDPNTSLTDVLTQVSGDVELLLAQLQAELNAILDNALDYVDVTIQSSTVVTETVLGTEVEVATLDISYAGTLQDLLDGTRQIEVSATLAGEPVGEPLLSEAEALVQDAVVVAVNDALGTIVAATGTAVDALVTELAAALDPVLDAISGLLDITLNEQNVSDGMTSEAWVTAVDIDVLTGPLAGVTLDLATSSVGPNVYAPITPVIDATDDPVSGGTDAPVDGSGWHPNSEVTLTLFDADGNPVLGPDGNPVTVTVTTDGTGAFPAGTTIPLPEGLDAGTYTVRATDALGNTATDTITVIEPVLDATDQPVAAGDDAPVTSTGWTPNTTVTLQLTDAAGNPVGDPITVTTDEFGNFPAGTTFPVPEGIADGDYTLVATDPFGNTATDTLTVDSTAPVVAITSPADGEEIAETSPVIEGTVDDPDATVNVTITDADGNVVFEGPATVNPDGTWFVDLAAEGIVLAEGDYTITATATDDAGNTSEPDTSTFTVDTTAPVVEITAPADGDVSTDASPTVTGTVDDPTATVVVTLTDADGNVVFEGPATVDDDGTWFVDLEREGVVLGDGSYTVLATATDAAGNTDTDEVTFSVDTGRALAPPVITSPTDGEQVGQTPTVTGTGEPGATVTVYADGAPAATAQVGADGLWSTVLPALACGPHTLTATQTVDGASSRMGHDRSTASARITSAHSEPVDVTVACPSGGVADDDGVLPDTGAGYGMGVLVLMSLLGLVMVAAGARMVRRHHA